MKPVPGLTIETGEDGVRRVVVHVDRGGSSAAGFGLLLRALPALKALDRLVREPAAPRKPEAPRP